MIHYWGAKAICDRLAFRSPSKLKQFIDRHNLPVFLRKHGSRPEKIYYSSESALTAWELAKGLEYRLMLRSKAARKTRERRTPSGKQGYTQARPYTDDPGAA